MRTPFSQLALVTALASGPAAAQLGLPGVQLPTRALERTVGTVARTAEPVLTDAGKQLAALREARISRLVRDNPAVLELTADGYAARRGEVLVFGPSTIALQGLRSRGFVIVGEETIEGLGVSATRLRIPVSVRMRNVGELIGRAAPGLEWSPDHIFEQSGRVGRAARSQTGPGPISVRIGVIDGAPGPGQTVAASKGFALGAPVPSNHGSAIVSLLGRAGARNVAVADVYGSDPAGGSASAVARGLGRLVAGGAKIVTISLVGADNPLLKRSIAAAANKGVVIVAAVGNDGPAAPPVYPASYPTVVAVTGVDKRNRALIEAGRALHLDYAAPGADIAALDARGKSVALRGTSFAVPLAAARIASAMGANWRAAVDAESVDLGKKGHDPVYGRGLLCGNCR